MMSTPFYCNQCGRDLIAEDHKNSGDFCNHCKNKTETQIENSTYKGLLGESTWWKERK